MAAISYKCPNCGGPLGFDPESQHYRCPYCQSVFTEKELDALSPSSASEEQAPDLNPEGMPGSTEESRASGEQAVIYRCPSCGAEVVTSETTAATFCYYCHSPVVLEGRVSGDYLPDSIIPFQIDRKKAVEQFLSYVRHKKFVPHAFFNRDQIEKLSGIYYPFWTVDYEIQGEMEGTGNKVRVWMSGDIEFTETSIFHFERGGSVKVKKLMRNALKESQRELIDSVMPYRLENLEPFHMGNLMGFAAERRSLESREISPEMEEKARSLASAAFRKTVSRYSSVQVRHGDFQPISEHWSYLLLPVWVLTYGALSGNKYYFAMNGQTGETHGVLPVSFGKLLGASALLGSVVFALVLGILYMFF